MRIASLSNFSQLGLKVMSYTISPSSTAINEGDTVTFTLSTFGVETGTTLYWTTTGTVSSADFSDSATSGTVITSGDTTTFTRTVAQDALTEGAETFQIQIRINSTSGEVVTTSDVITISDRVYTVVPSSSAVTEGTSLSFSVSTVNVSNGTLYWSINHITTVNADFSAVSGSFSLTSNAGTFSITTIADLTTEGDETFTVSVRISSTSGTVVATSSTVTITDTSTTPLSQAVYTVPGSYSWVAPAGVSSVSVVCVGAGGGGGATYGGGGGGGALAYANGITVVPGNSYTVQVGAGGGTGSIGVSGGNSYFSSSTFLQAGGGTGGYSGNSNSAGGGGGAGGYGANGGAGQFSNSTTRYTGGTRGAASGTGLTLGWYGGGGGYGGNTVTSFALTAGTAGGAGSGGRGTNGGSGEDGGGVGLLGQGSSGAATPAWNYGSTPAYTENAGSNGQPGYGTLSGLFGGGGGGSSAGSGGAVRIVWPGNERYFPTTRVDDEPTPSGTFAFTSQPTTMAENISSNFVCTASGSPQLYLYWTILHGTTVNSDFVAVSGVINKLSTNTITITPTISGGASDRTFQLEIRVGSVTGTVVATSSTVTLLITGQQVFTTIGTSTFTVPAGVSSISVVAVGGGGGGGKDYAGGGGGGLGYKNNYSVSPGQQFTVVVGDYGRSPLQGSTNGGDSYFNTTSVCKGGGGDWGYRYSPLPLGGTYTGDGGGNGGQPGIGGGGTASGPGGNYWGSGGGAGGYAGRGGNGATSSIGGAPVTNSGGGGGGGAGINTAAYGGAGGGVGIYGKGSDGVGGTGYTYSGSGGSSGSPTSSTQYGYGPYNYGAGGSGASAGSGYGRGGQGAVRIIWPGTLRQFPSTGTGDF